MLTFLRRMINSKVGVVISFLLLLTFALLFGIGDIVGLGRGGTVAKDDVVSIGKVGVSSADLRGRVEIDYQNYFQQAQQARQQPLPLAQYIAAGGMDATYERLINSLAIEQFATNEQMSVTDKYALAQITPDFKNPATGQFDQRLFDQYLQQQRTSASQITRDIRQQLLQRQLLIPTGNASQVPNKLALPYASALLERRDGQIGLIPASAVHPGPAPTDTELADFYKRNTPRYIVPERRAIRYAIVTPEQVAAEAAPTEKEVADSYQSQRTHFLPTEKRTIVQVLVADQAAANALAAKVKGGSSLEAAAQGIGLAAATIKDTDKTAYTAQGSDALAAAAFGASKGALVGPIRTPLGYAVARIEAITQVPGKTLDQARPEIVKALTLVKTQAALGKLHDAIDDAISGKASFSDVVANHKLTATTTAPLISSGVNPDDPKAQPDAKLLPIVQAAFAIDPAQGPQMAPIGNDGSFALLAIDHIVAAAPRPLAQMRDTVVKDFNADRNLREARRIADTVQAQLNKGVPIAQALSGTGLALKPAQSVSAARAQLIPKQDGQQPSPVLTQLFRMAERSAKVMVTPDNAGYLIIWVGKITPGDASAQRDVVSGVRSGLARGIGREYVDQFAKAVRASVGVNKNAAALATLRATLSGQSSPDQP